MPRFFVSKDNIDNGSLIIRGDDAYHIARSLRMAVGDTVVVSDGAGSDYECSLERIRDDECECRIIKTEMTRSESPVKITLFMAYPKGDKLETVTQKAVELGASCIVPFESSRCIKKPKEDKVQKQTLRLSKIAEEAAKQSGRGVLPTVLAPKTFKEMLECIKAFPLALFCYEGKGTVSLKSVLQSSDKIREIAVIIGSEGGFSPTEAEEICSCGAKAVNLGPRILRCETAPDYALSAISYYYEL